MTTALKILFTLALVFGLSNCGGTKNTSEMNDNADQAAKEAQMLADGYLKGTIRFSDVEGDCPYVIEVENEDYNYMLDPVNLEEAFMKDGKEVWFKFAGLRRPNRCIKANPIELLEIRSGN